jgi:acyl dehydratase
VAADKTLIGSRLPRQRVVVERPGVQRLAEALLDENPIYRDASVAGSAGFGGIPAPPTFSFSMPWWGAYQELQDPGDARGDPGVEALQRLRAEQGGTLLHGEQEFVYHRPITVGDDLVGEGSVVDVYTKESGSRVMTFCVTETNWMDARSGDPVITSRFTLIHMGKRPEST